MSLSSVVDIAVFAVATLAIGGGVLAVSGLAWASIVIGGILLSVLILSRVRGGGKQ